jgi:hypothetical protein
MILSKRLRLALALAPLLVGAVALAVPAQASPPTGGTQHHVDSGTHATVHDFHHRHDFFGFGFWEPWWWGWDPVQYWAYPYPYYYPPAYYAPPPPAPQAPVEATGAPPPQFWYYCDNPQGYYPYVANCSSAWRQVTPTPQSGNTVTPRAKQ